MGSGVGSGIDNDGPAKTPDSGEGDAVGVGECVHGARCVDERACERMCVRVHVSVRRSERAGVTQAILTVFGLVRTLSTSSFILGMLRFW